MSDPLVEFSWKSGARKLSLGASMNDDVREDVGTRDTQIQAVSARGMIEIRKAFRIFM